MKYFLLVAIMAIAATFMPSCQKHTEGPQFNTNPSSVTPPPAASKKAATGGGDDDGSIIIHNVKTTSMQPLSNANVVMTNGTDSLTQTTDSTGSCTFHLAHRGRYHEMISHDGYESRDTVLCVGNSIQEQTTVLEDQ